MSDSYQAIYDAVRSRIHGGDIGSAVRDALQGENIGHYVSMASESIREIASDVKNEATRPSVLFRPALTIDGNQWCALYGENLQDGVAGFGDSPALAMADFDTN